MEQHDDRFGFETSSATRTSSATKTSSATRASSAIRTGSAVETSFAIETSVVDGAVEVRVTGDIDIATVDAFRAVLWAQPPRAVLRVDLSGVSLLSATGVRALAAAHLRLRARGGQLLLVEPQPMVSAVLRSTRLHRVIPVVGRSRSTRAAANRPLVVA